MSTFYPLVKADTRSPEQLKAQGKVEAITLEECLETLYGFYKKYTPPDIIKKSQEVEAEWEDQGKSENCNPSFIIDCFKKLKTNALNKTKNVY